MALPTIYHAHPITGVYIGVGEADPDPLEGEGAWLIPAHAYTFAPPEVNAAQCAILNAGHTEWVIIDRDQGTYEYGLDGNRNEKAQGPVLPTEPEPATLEQLKNAKRRDIDLWRLDAERVGMQYAFPGGSDVVQMRDERDRVNINAQVTIAILMKGNGVTDAVLPFRAASNTTYMMTPDEMIAMGVAVATFSSELYQIGWGLKELVDDADDETDLEQIVWPTS